MWKQQLHVQHKLNMRVHTARYPVFEANFKLDLFLGHRMFSTIPLDPIPEKVRVIPLIRLQTRRFYTATLRYFTLFTRSNAKSIARRCLRLSSGKNYSKENVKSARARTPWSIKRLHVNGESTRRARARKKEDEEREETREGLERRDRVARTAR